MATQGYVFNERPPAGVLVAQAVGITASAYLFGQNASISLISVPAIMKAPADLAVQQWSTVFGIGQMFGPPLAIIGGLATGYVAYNQDPSSTAFKLNLAATILFPSIVPFTFAFIVPTNKKLFEKERLFSTSGALSGNKNKNPEVGVEKSETVHALIDKWATLNLARALITGVGAVLAVWAAVDKREVFGVGGVRLGTGADRI